MARACDRCGRLLEETEVRYIVEIAVTADVPPEIDPSLFEQDVAAEMARLLRALESVSQEDAEAEVHQKMMYLLCPSCRRVFVQNPLGRIGGWPSFLQ